MKRVSRDFDLVIGVVDGDKTSEPRYFDEFEFLNKENTIQLWQKVNSEVEYSISIVGEKTGIETFVLRSAEQVGISPNDYGFELTVKNYARDSKVSISKLTRTTSGSSPISTPGRHRVSSPSTAS